MTEKRIPKEKYMNHLIPGLLLIPMLLSGCTAAPPSGAGAPVSLSTQYQIEKVNHISDLILERQVIPQDYFRFVDEDVQLQEKLQSYNDLTVSLTESATSYATSILSGLVEADEETAQRLIGPVCDHMDVPEQFHTMEGQIAHWSLYENAAELCRADPQLTHIIVPESGGSWGMWPSWLHTFGSVSDTTDQEYFQEYLALIDTLMDDLDQFRDALVCG